LERESREPRPTTAVNPDDGFRSFVAAVSLPLTRLAYVLTVGLAGQPAAGALAANALAQARRQWRDVEAAGLPEQLAVDDLLSAVLRRRVGSPSPDPLSNVPIDVAEVGLDGDQQLLRDACWRAFVRLSPRQRAALVFADPSVVDRRLAGLDVTPSLGSPRRQLAVWASAIAALRSALQADAAVIGNPATRIDLEALADEQLVLLAGDAIRAHATAAPPVFDPNTEVGARVRQLHQRAMLAGALVVVSIAAAGVTAVLASAPTAVAPRAASPAASSAVPSSAGLPPLVQVATQPSTDPNEPVVPWPVRGGLVDDPVLLARIEAAFSQAHPDATSQPQVLLVTDTPAFRIAFVTATSPNGVMESWFSAPTGSPNLVESAFTRSREPGLESVVAARLHRASGTDRTATTSPSPTELVVIALPTAPSIQLFDDVKGSRATESLTLHDGIAVEAVGPRTVGPSPTQINVTLGTYALADIPDIELDPSKSYATGDAATQHLAAVPAVTVERGRPDPALLADALLVAQAWAPTDPSAAGAPVAVPPVVLWGGTDSVGTKLVVARVHANLFDLLILEWSGDAPRLHGEVLVRSTSPEVPVAFAYRSAQVTRIGVIATADDKAVALAFAGRESPTAMFDDTGFASIPLSGDGGLPSDVNVNASPPPSNDFPGLIDATVQVELFGWNDGVRASLSVPPTL
jgi:hypothetical protein